MFIRLPNYRLMSKIIAYLLIITTNIQILAGLWFCVGIQWQRQAQHAYILCYELPNERLTMLDLSREQRQSSDFERINSQEIKYKGKRYDIIKTIEQGKVTRFVCVQDQYEESLHQALKKQVSQQQPASDENNALIHQIFKQYWLYNQPLLSELSSFLSLEACMKAHYINHFTSYRAEVDVPPPQLA